MKILLSLPCDCSNYREYYFCDFYSFHVSLITDLSNLFIINQKYISYEENS